MKKDTMTIYELSDNYEEVLEDEFRYPEEIDTEEYILKCFQIAADLKLSITYTDDTRRKQMLTCVCKKYQMLEKDLIECLEHQKDKEILTQITDKWQDIQLYKIDEVIEKKKKEDFDHVIDDYIHLLEDLRRDIEVFIDPILLIIERLETTGEDPQGSSLPADYQIKDIGEIPGFESYQGMYSIDTNGIVRNAKGKELKQFRNDNGYLITQLSNKGNFKTVRIHTLVAKAFIPNPQNLPIVNHKDTDKTNNHINNLEWTTSSKNTYHAIEHYLCTRTRKVKELSPTGEVVRIFPAITYAARFFKVSVSVIDRICKGYQSRKLNKCLVYA